MYVLPGPDIGVTIIVHYIVHITMYILEQSSIGRVHCIYIFIISVISSVIIKRD